MDPINSAAFRFVAAQQAIISRSIVVFVVDDDYVLVCKWYIIGTSRLRSSQPTDSPTTSGMTVLSSMQASSGGCIRILFRH